MPFSRQNDLEVAETSWSAAPRYNQISTKSVQVESHALLSACQLAEPLAPARVISDRAPTSVQLASHYSCPPAVVARKHRTLCTFRAGGGRAANSFENVFFSHSLCCSGVAVKNSVACACASCCDRCISQDLSALAHALIVCKILKVARSKSAPESHSRRAAHLQLPQARLLRIRPVGFVLPSHNCCSELPEVTKGAGWSCQIVYAKTLGRASRLTVFKLPFSQPHATRGGTYGPY